MSHRMLSDGLRQDRLLLLQSWRLPVWATRAASLGGQDQETFNGVLGQMLSRGVPLVEALDVAREAMGAGAAGIVERIGKAVSAGKSFADACREVSAFDEVTIAVYRAAERTGELGEACEQLGRSIKRQRAVAGKAVTLLIYPAVVLTLASIVSLAMLMFIVPMLGRNIRQMAEGSGEGQIPLFSRVVFAAGEAMNAHWMLVVGSLVSAVLLAVVFRAGLWRLGRTASRRMPMVRDLIRAQETTRFFSVMASMTRSGVPLAEALATGNQAVLHPKLRAQLETMQRRLVEGAAMPMLIEAATELPVTTRRLLVAAERAGDLEATFEVLATDSADEVERRSARLLAALEPILIVLISVMIGSLVIAIMVPILTAASSVG
ncbi:MAG: type II secretion system F family protein [Planctomycetes bacterium]|nr:type II secretion system F family protein [Planctomycetota bacterium]